MGAWPKGITVGNWREGGCAAQSLIHSYSFISTTVDKTQLLPKRDGSVAEWLACVQIAAATLPGNSLRQTVHTHRASVHQAAKLVAALLRVARVTAGLAENNGSLPPGL